MVLCVASSNLNFRKKIDNLCYKTNVDDHICPHCGKPINETNICNNDLDKEKKEFLSNEKKAFINLYKFFVDICYMSYGAIKGTVYGTTAGLLVIGGTVIRNILKHSPKVLTTGNKICAGAIALTILAGTLFSSKLDSNERKAQLDHRWGTGHNG